MPAPTPTPDTVLAFDTSTERMAVAVQAGDQVLLDNRLGGAAASASLLPTIEALLQLAGQPLSSVAVIGFGHGPGAFTGLRTSCAVAQGLAFGLGCPVLPIDSLLIVAEQARRQQAPGADDLDVGVVMDARMGETYAARYRWCGGAWQTLQAPALWSPLALAEAWAGQPPALSAGSGLEPFDTVLREACPPAQRVTCDDDRAAALLALTLAASRLGVGLDAAQALPLYLRDKVAQTIDERAAMRAATDAGTRPAATA